MPDPEFIFFCIVIVFLAAAGLLDHARLVRLERMYLDHLKFHRS